MATVLGVTPYQPSPTAPSAGIPRSADGGGIFAYYATATLTNSTISGNTAGASGGGIASGTGSAVTLESASVANNQSGEGTGGGIYSFYDSMSVKNTIVANNTKVIGDETTTDDYYRDGGILTDNGYNGIGVSNTGSWTETGDWNDTDGDGTFTQVGTGFTGTLDLSDAVAEKRRSH